MKLHKVTIVVPVYADWPSLKDCLDSLKQFVNASHNIILVNDCGPEADLMERKIIAAIEGHHNFTYFRNTKNLGFGETCNRAVMELDTTDNDVLLLNSDTKVTEGFLEEMLGVLYASDKIGTVSPRTNNATIATVPLSSMQIKGIEPEKSYKIFQKLQQKLPRYSVVPTAHGFCMLLRRSLIKKYGLFDEVFGKGYGEEVDFCQRIKKHGYLSVLANRAYVYHLEARSFSLATKQRLIAEHSQIINRRYPTYSQAVREYIKEALFREEGIKVPASPNLTKLARQLYNKLKTQIFKF